MTSSWRAHAAALAGYTLLAVVFSWPLAARLDTHLTGPPSGDTGVYVWNLWVFRHEIVAHGRVPLSTNEIFSLTPPVNLSLHNYTIFSNALAFPLIPLFGIVAAFNLVYLATTVLTAYAMFLLARFVARDGRAAWLAGALFAWSPTLVARSTAHFSLVAAAPLPIFVLLLLKARETGALRYAAAAGVTIAWAAFCDAYYAVYCLLIGAFMAAASIVRFSSGAAGAERSRIVARALNAAIACVGGFVAVVALTGGGQLALGGLRIRATTLYTPVLLLTVLVGARVLVQFPPRLAETPAFPPGRAWRPLAWVACFLLAASLSLSPVLYALGQRVSEGRYVNPPVHWRSSPRGVDALALIVPNPNHPLAGDASRDAIVALTHEGFAEGVASLPLVAVGLLIVAWWRLGARPPRFWLMFTAVFAAMALGPFVTVGGLNTHVPTPWTFLRYVPVVSNARSPGRFMVVVLLGVSVLFALAVADALRGRPARRRGLTAVLACLLLFELLPAPRRLHSAEVPQVYSRITADPRDVRVLELPTGIRDGASSFGDYSALAQYYQTHHGKPLIGGYLSRVSARRVRQFRELPVLDALLTLSERRPLTAEQDGRARASSGRFLTRSRLGYVIIDATRASPELRRFAIELLRLKKVGESGPRELYVPQD